MSTRHKHYDVIVAFAEGRAVQYRPTTLDTWKDWNHKFLPSFDPTTKTEYRIKPQKAWRWVYARKSAHSGWHVSYSHYASKERFEEMYCELIAIEPVLSTEKEM